MGIFGGLIGGAGGFLLGGPAGAAAGYSVGSSIGGHKSAGSGGAQGKLNTAADQYGGYATQDRNRYLAALGNGQESLNNYAQGAMGAAMPQLHQQIQGAQESANRRGISNGDLGTSYEGDIYSAFDKNLTNAIAGQSMNLFNTQAQGYGNLANESSNNYLDLLAGNRDAGIQQQNSTNGLIGSVIGAAGQIGGAYLGRK